MAITEVNRKKGKGKKAFKKILKKGNTCKNRQKGGNKGPPYTIRCYIVGEDGKAQDDGVSFTQGTLPDMEAKMTQRENKQNTKIERLETKIEEWKKKINNLPAGIPSGTTQPVTTSASGTAPAQAGTTPAQAGTTPAQADTTLGTTLAQAHTTSGQAPPASDTVPGTSQSDTSQQPTDAVKNAKSTVQQEQQKTIEIFNNKKMKSIILLKQAYILKLLVLKNNVKKGTFKIEYKDNANANSQLIELTYLDMLSINGDVENFKKYIGDANANANATINKITLTIGTNIQKEFNTLQEIIEFLNALENFNFNDLFTSEEIKILNNSKGTTSTGGGKKRKYRRAIKKALKQKSVKGCVKININEKNKKRKKTFNRKIKIRNGSLRKK